MTQPDDMVGVSASTLARLVASVVNSAARQNLTVPPKMNAALIEALVALDLDTDVSNIKPLLEIAR